MGSGGSFGCSPLRQEIGLGDATSIETVEVYWPVSRKHITYTGAALDGFFLLTEGQSQAVPLHLKSFKWPIGVSSAAAIPKARLESVRAFGVN